MARIYWLVAVIFLLVGCLEVDRVDITIDTRTRTASLSYRDLRGDEADLRLMMTSMLSDGTFTAPMPRARLVSQDVVPRDGRLDLDVKMAFDDPVQASVHGFDARYPYRLCAPPDTVITETNASARDPQGCALWRRGTRVLRVTAQNRVPLTETSLLPAFQAWEARGRPPFEAPSP